MCKFILHIIIFTFTLPVVAGQTHSQAMWYGTAYDLYLPEIKATQKSMKLVVALHGCKQSGVEFAQNAHWIEQADIHQFALLVPQQSRFRNFDGCWNWFSNENQIRNENTWSEIGGLISLIRLVGVQLSVDTGHTFLVGMSAGAAMAINLAICFPEDFSGVAAHSGLAFRPADDLESVQKALLSGSSLSSAELIARAKTCAPLAQIDNQLKKIMLIHGEKDPRVVPKNSEQLFLQVQQALPDVKSKFKLIPGLNHRWSGGSGDMQFNDPNSPDVTKEILKYFKF